MVAARLWNFSWASHALLKTVSSCIKKPPLPRHFNSDVHEILMKREMEVTLSINHIATGSEMLGSAL